MMQLFGSQQLSLSLSPSLSLYIYLYVYIFIIHIFLYVILFLYLTATYSDTFSDCTFAYDCANNLKVGFEEWGIIPDPLWKLAQCFFWVCIWRYHPRSRPWSFESTTYTSPISPSRSSCSLWFSPTPYFEANGNNGNPKVIAVTMTFMNMMKGFILEHHTLGKLPCWLCRLLSWMIVLQLDVVPRTDDVRVGIGMTVTGWSCLE